MVSRNTLINDLDDLRYWFNENELSFVSQPRKGLIVLGSENHIRKGLLKLLLLNDFMHEYEERVGNNIFHTLLLQQLDADGRIKSIKAILKKAENEQDIFLTDFSFRKMCYFLLILLDRTEKGKLLGELSAEEWDKVRCSSKYLLAEITYTELIDMYDIPSHCAELASIIEQLRAESYIKNNKPNQDTDMVGIQIIINEFIYKLSKVYNIHYYLNFYLYDLLLSHMETVAYRVRRNNILICPMTDQLEKEYTDKFREVERLVRPLEEYINAKVSRDEIAFIVIYLLAILENNKAIDIPVNVLLVCSTGRGSAQLILAKISSAFESIVVHDVISSHRIYDMPLQDIDMILSTVPIGEQVVPVIQISPLLSDDDEYRIRQETIQIQRKKRLLSRRPVVTDEPAKQSELKLVLQNGKKLHELLSAGRVMLGAEAEGWREAVRLAGNILYENGFIEERYTQSMIRIIEANGPYSVIYPGIAIPHAEHSDGSLREGASLVRLSRPVLFNHKENDPVIFIIAFSLIDSKSISRALYNLTKMLATDNFVQSLRDAKDAAELMDCVNQYESLVDVTGR